MTLRFEPDDPLLILAKQYLSRFAKEGPHGWIEREAPALAELLARVRRERECK